MKSIYSKNTTIWGVLLLCLVLLGAISLISQRHFSVIERDEVIEDVLQAQSLLKTELDQLLTTADDYAAWDDTYRFVRDHNQAYLVHSLGNTYFAKVRLNLLCIVSLDGEVIYSRFETAHLGHRKELPGAIRRYLSPEGVLVGSVSKDKELSGIIELPEGLMLIAATPILTTESQGPSRGTLILGRLLTVAEVEKIGKKAGFRLGLTRTSCAETFKRSDTLRALLIDAGGIRISELDSATVQGELPLTDISGRQVGCLLLAKSRQAYQAARTIILAIDILIIGVCGVVAYLFWRLSKKLTVVSLNEHLLDVQLRVFVEMAVDAIFRLDRHHHVLNANQRATEISGYSLEELKGVSFESLFDQASLQQRPLNEDLLNAGGTDTLRLSLLHRSGTSVPVVVRIKYLPDGMCQCVMQDLTEQMHWENTLHRHEELLNGIINGTSDIVYAKDKEGCYLLMNAAGVQFAGKALEDVLGQKDEDIFPRCVAEVLACSDSRISSASDIVSTEDILPLADGSSATFLATRGALTDKKGQVIGLFAILHDITIRTMLEKELLEQHKKLGQMSVKISLAEEQERVRIAEELHDQVGPTLLLSKMKLEMLQNHLTKDMLRDEAEAIGALIAQAFKDIRSLTLQLRPPILANAGLEAAIKWLAEEFHHKYGITIELHDDKQPKPIKYEKRSILFQVVRELLLNVVKHAQVETVAVTVRRSGGAVQLLVEDSGVGFMSSSDATARSSSGGFGLFNISQKLSHIHGTLSIESVPGHGTRALVTAPLDSEP